MQIYSLAVGVCCKASALAASAFATNTYVLAINLHQGSAADLNPYTKTSVHAHGQLPCIAATWDLSLHMSPGHQHTLGRGLYSGHGTAIVKRLLVQVAGRLFALRIEFLPITARIQYAIGKVYTATP